MPEKIPMTTVPDDFSLRLKNKFPMLQNFTERPFGVEIEFFGMDYVITPLDNGIIKPYCISSRGKNGCHIQELCQDYNLLLGTSKDSWHIQQDTSVRGKCHIKHGAELTSPILSGIEGLVQVYQAFRFLSDVEGLDIDESCGFHVHHGADPAVYNCNQLQRLVNIVKHYEDHFYQLIPGNRQNAKTCRPMELDVKAFLDVRDGDSAARNCRIKNLWYSTENRYDKKAAENSRYNKTRYHGLNLHSYWYRSTVEFRYHSAVLEKPDEALQWIIFTQFLIEFSREHVPDIYYYPEANKWLKTIYKIYKEFGYQNRIKQLVN